MTTRFCALACALMLAAFSVAAQNTVLSGRVVDADGTPVPGAAVFVEPGQGGELVRVAADTQGDFQLEGPFTGGVGLFAVAPGRSFGGVHLNLALGEREEGLRLVLDAPSSLSGKVTTDKNAPVAGARITRIGLVGPSKVGIPLAKLAAFGFEEPATDREGRFTVTGLPSGGRVAVKVGHPEYAQEAVDDLVPGNGNVAIRMWRGVTVRGEVRLRGDQSPVSGAAVILRSAQPPHDSAVARTDAFGVFNLRLKPGVYLAQATAAGQATPGWQRVTITGESLETSVHLGLAGTGTVRGVIADASTGLPIEGARIRLESAGNVAAILRSGPSGEFRAAAAEGDNVLYFESTPGYMPPEPRGVRVSVAGGRELELPGIWLAPLPVFRVQVLDEDEETPVPGAVISLLRPRQFGWLASGADGWAEIRIANLPPDGRIVGLVEHPGKPSGAVFSLARSDAAGAAVKLLPLASVSGRVVDGKGAPLPNIIVGAVYPDSPENDPLLLWRTVTGPDGAFRWDAVVPGVPQHCAAYGGGSAQGEGMPFNLAPAAAKELDSITLAEGAARAGTAPPQKVDWRKNRLLCGAAPAGGARPAVVVYCEAHEAGAAVEGLHGALVSANLQSKWDAAVVVRGGYSCTDAPLPVYAGSAPDPAGTLLVDPDGKVTLRTFGLPPLRSLAAPR